MKPWLQLGAINKEAGDEGILPTHGVPRFGGDFASWKDIAGRDWHGEAPVCLGWVRAPVWLEFRMGTDSQ